jgi:hypothetical protein
MKWNTQKNAKRDALMSKNKSADRLFDALCEIERLQSQWVSVTERLPEVKKDTLVLCQFRDFDDKWTVDTKTFWVSSRSFSGACKVEYWQPLPPPK